MQWPMQKSCRIIQFRFVERMICHVPNVASDGAVPEAENKQHSVDESVRDGGVTINEIVGMTIIDAAISSNSAVRYSNVAAI